MSSETWLKADNIAHKFFCKLALLVYNARASTVDSHKLDKWFNLETPDTDIFKDHLRIYRAISTLAPPIPPFELQVLLVVPDLATNQVLVLTDPSSARRTHVKPTPSHVLLESWLVVFTPSASRPTLGSSTSSSSSSSSQEIALSSVYKQSITLFRSLFTLLRILPAYKLTKRLKRAGADSSQLSIQVRVHTQSPPARSESILRFGDAISPPSPIPSPSPMPTRTRLPPNNATNIPQSSTSNTSAPLPTSPLSTSTYTFPAVSHPLGALSIAVTYLLSPTFHIDTLESLLSSRFLSQSRDDESFVPTIAARQAQAQSGSLRSMGGLSNYASGAALSKSPPRPVPPPLKATGTGFGSPSLADRFILPPGGSVSSVRSASSRPVSLLSSGSAGSGHGETAVGPLLPSSIQAAATAGASAVPIKRPSISINPLINPFKSPTLSSTSAPHSLHSQYSPHSIHSQYSFHSSGAVVQLGTAVAAGEHGPTLPSRPPSTLSSQQHPFPSVSQIPPSPSLRHVSGGSLSGLGTSSSPAGIGTTGSSPASVSSQMGQQSVGPRKYVSSFSHRRQSSALVSERSSVVEKVESNTDIVVQVPSTPSSAGGLVPAAGHIKETSNSSASTTTTAAATNPPTDVSFSSPFSVGAEEDELSAFVQAIDERIPLGSMRSRLKGNGGGRHPLRMGDGSETAARRESLPTMPSRSALSASPHQIRPSSQQLSDMPTSRQSSSPIQPPSRNSPLPTLPTLPTPDPRAAGLPRSRAAIDAELKRMADEFMTSLSTLNFNNPVVGATGAGVMRRRTASGVSSSRSSGSASPGRSGPSPLGGALGLARRVSLAGGSPSGSVGSSSASGSGLVSGTGSPLARSPPRGGYRPLYPPAPPPGPSGLNTTSSSPSANTSPSNLRAPNPTVHQYSSAPSQATPAHPRPHSHASTQPHQGSPLRSAIPLDESSSSSPSPTDLLGRGDGDADSGSGELGSGYGLGIGMAGNVVLSPSSGTARGNYFGSPPRSRPVPVGSGGTTGQGQGSPSLSQGGGGLIRRILTRTNASDEVIGRLEVDDIGTAGGGEDVRVRSPERRGSEGFSMRDQVVYPFPGTGIGTNTGISSNSNDHEGTDKGGKRGNGYRIV